VGLVGEIVIAAFNGLIYYPDNNLLHSLMDKGEVTFGSSVNSRIFLVGLSLEMTEGWLREWILEKTTKSIEMPFLTVSLVGPESRVSDEHTL